MVGCFASGTRALEIKIIFMKAVILAGGNGSRLFPCTLPISKQLLPVYDKPSIYYPLTTLLSLGVKSVCVICKPVDVQVFNSLLGDGSQFGIEIVYQIQERPGGLAEAPILAESFIGGEDFYLILGDNIFCGDVIANSALVHGASDGIGHCKLFSKSVARPEYYGVLNKEFSRIDEKPIQPKSSFAVTGLYYYPGYVVEICKGLSPSKRGELEITDLNNCLLKRDVVDVYELIGVDWYDTGDFNSLLEVSELVRSWQHRQGELLGSPHIEAFRRQLISFEQVERCKSYYANPTFDLHLKKIRGRD